MKNKKRINPAQAVTDQDKNLIPEGPPLTVMAVQEILGLFTPKKGDEDQDQDRHDYLKNKPLGLI